MSTPNLVTVGAPSDQRCQHINSRGHRCRMLTSGGHDGLCQYHINRLEADRAKNDQAVAAALLHDIDEFCTADSVNLFLGNLLKQLVHKRLDRRDAIAQAYICQLLLNTLPHMQRESELESEAMALLNKSYTEEQRAPLARQDSGGPSSVSIPLYPAQPNHEERG